MADAGRGSAYYIERTDWASGVKQRASESRRSRHLAKERIRRTEA